MFIHVVEQVQLFKWGQPILISSTSESGIVRGEKVAPMRRTVLTQLVNLEVPLIKKNVRNSRLEVMEKSRLLCVGMWDQLHVLFQSAVSFSVDAHAKFWIGLHAEEQRKRTQRNGKLCRHAPAHEHTAPQWCAPIYSCLLSGWCWGKGLVAGQRSWRWDFMAKAER